MPTGAYTAASVMVMEMIGPTSSRAAVDGRAERRLARVDVPLDVLHHHDRIVDDQPDREHDREQRQQVDA